LRKKAGHNTFNPSLTRKQNNKLYFKAVGGGIKKKAPPRAVFLLLALAPKPQEARILKPAFFR